MTLALSSVVTRTVKSLGVKVRRGGVSDDGLRGCGNTCAVEVVVALPGCCACVDRTDCGNSEFAASKLPCVIPDVRLPGFDAPTLGGQGYRTTSS